MRNYSLVLFAFFLCSSNYARAEIGVTDTEILIGAHTTESGPLAASAPFATAQTAYYDMINEKGGVNGRKIKFIRKDTQSLAPKNVEAIRGLVEKEKVFAVVGSSGSAHSAVYKYLHEKGVPDFYFADFSSVYTDKSLVNTFPLFYTTFNEAAAQVRYLAAHKKAKKICVLATKDPTGQEYLQGVTDTVAEINKKAAPGNKIEMGPVASVERLAPQADAEVLKFKEAKCDTVMTSSLPPLAPKAINYASDQDYKPQWVVTAYCANPKFVGLIIGNTDGIIASTNIARDESTVPNKANWEKYESLMKKNNIPISGLSMNGFTIAEMFVETLKRAGKDLNRKNVAKAALTYKDYWCSLCVGPYNTSEKNRTLASEPRLIITKNKNWALLDK